MASAIVMPIKVIKLQDHPIKLAHFEETTWVSLKSLAAFLNLNYDKQVRELAGNTSIASLGRPGSIKPQAKLFVDADGDRDLWIPMDNVSLFATRVAMEDLSKMDRQNLCATQLPSLMARAF